MDKGSCACPFTHRSVSSYCRLMASGRGRLLRTLTKLLGLAHGATESRAVWALGSLPTWGRKRRVKDQTMTILTSFLRHTSGGHKLSSQSME